MPEPGLSPRDGASARADIVAAWRDAADAGLRYYGRLGGLALELAETLVPAVGDLRPTVRRGSGAPEPAARPTPGPGVEQVAQTIVIEAAAGKKGLGVFMVENTTARAVSAPVGVSALVAPSGEEVRPAVAFSPEVVTLDPGDQVLVQVAAAVDETLEPDVRYSGEISIPRLAGAGIPIVVRRRPAPARTRKRAAKPRPARRQSKTRSA